MRTVLTLIGVVMGVASVIMVITLVNGANKYVSTKLSGYGADVFTVSRMSSIIFSAEDYFKYQKRKIIRIEDYQAVRDGCTLCSEVGALLNQSTTVVANGHSSDNTTIRGYTWTMFGLQNVDIAQGRGFTQADEDHGTHVVVVGPDIVDNLLGASDPIGKEIRVNGTPYTIVGVGSAVIADAVVRNAVHHSGSQIVDNRPGAQAEGRRGAGAGQRVRPIAGQLGSSSDYHLSADLWLQRLVGHLRTRQRQCRGDGASAGRGACDHAFAPARCARYAR